MYDESNENLQTIEGILDSLSKKGYQFVTVNELQKENKKVAYLCMIRYLSIYIMPSTFKNTIIIAIGAIKRSKNNHNTNTLYPLFLLTPSSFINTSFFILKEQR